MYNGYVKGVSIMKKLFICGLLGLSLVACSSGSSSEKATVCTIDEEYSKMEITLEPKDDKLKTMTVLMADDSTDYSEITDEELEMLEGQLESAMGEVDGVEMKLAVKDGELHVTLTLNVQDLKEVPAMMQTSGLTLDEMQNTSVKEIVEELEDSGATCK